MKTITASVVVNRPVQPVFDYFVQELQVDDEGSDPGLVDMTPSSIRKWGKNRFDGEKAWHEFEIDRAITTHTRNGSFVGTWTFEELPMGCKVGLECHLEPGGVFKLPGVSLIWLAVLPLLRRGIQGDLEEAKRALEDSEDAPLAATSGVPD